MSFPVLWSFRRCPYAMRARLAVDASGVAVDLREIVLRDKPDAFLAASPSATVPCLVDGLQTLDESLDIMVWALKQSDPLGWLEMPEEGWALIEENDGPFKRALDRTKYASRYPDSDPDVARARAVEVLQSMEARLAQGWLFGDRPTLADMAILPFVRQFAHIDLEWFNAQPWPHLVAWLNRFKSSLAFQRIMLKYQPWQQGDPAQRFPHAS